eukprot:NODE_10785_length_1329_cov_6.762895.p2 GENE.NODE_10785_length_1329_cov_6.762895~~NODE_10785_length_1329_cov_6.762895.p2  ORF type:complete len:352 (+),score=105.44 NODE_10785_length_1329_cov_6.762895:48-1103(+)
MLSRLATRIPRVLLRSDAALQQARGFAHSIKMVDSEFNEPASEKTLYPNEFVQATAEEHKKAWDNAKKHPSVHDPQELMPAHIGDPHQTYGFADWTHIHYDHIREPTFPRKPDLSKGELAAGATVTRTDVWHDPNEPAITSVAKLSPENFRPVGWNENAPNPTTTCPEGTLDFRANRLPLDHADRRPWVYFLAATAGFAYTAVARAIVAKCVHGLWPAKDVFAAGVIEVDIRPIRVGQNFVVKWRSKPVFVRRRTPEMIASARKDDVLAASMRDPQVDAQICKNPEWLVCIGVCTHLGCIPQPDAGNFGAYFCPCHGSHYDHAGRIRQGPAPKNLEVPPYQFIDEGTLKLG